MINFAINGFGRIGRSAVRVWLDKHLEDLNLTAINTSGSMPVSSWAHLLKHDTAYGLLPYQIEIEEIQDTKSVTDKNPLLGYFKIHTPRQIFRIPILAQKEPEKIPWSTYSVDVVLEATGVFRTQELAKKHLTSGVQLVIISAPAKDEKTLTSVIGVNQPQIIKKDRINTISVLSNASCTTNSIAPVASLMHSRLGVLKAMLTTIHGYTDDQNLQDNSHRDLRRARAAALNIVPTSTGAAKATTATIPELKGLFDGIALRVPIITGSITDFTFITKQPTTVEEVNQIFIDASRQPRYKNILAVTEEPLVSSDIIGRSESSIVDLNLTRVVDGTLVKVLAWYDNEWGYTNRLLEQITQSKELLD